MHLHGAEHLSVFLLHRGGWGWFLGWGVGGGGVLMSLINHFSQVTRRPLHGCRCSGCDHRDKHSSPHSGAEGGRDTRNRGSAGVREGRGGGRRRDEGMKVGFRQRVAGQE
jgi:hypothetical protein